MRALDQLLPPAEQARVITAIQAAERATSGEIKVHVERACPGKDAMARARALFQSLGLTRTRERNGVLVYVAIDDRLAAILGDQGIHAEVGETFWQEALDRMREGFRRGAFGDGLVGAVEAVGARLARRFPPRKDDVNELSDEISTDDGPDRPK
jgi:uncharacterized membrane protein